MKILREWKEREAIRRAKRLVQRELNDHAKRVEGVEYRESPATGKLRPVKPKVKRD